MQALEALMETEKPYLDSKLKIADIADRLHTDSRAVSACLKATHDITFAAYVGRHRIMYAQEQLRRRPDMKMTALCTEAGFSNETSFFRTFKAITGMTPGEWVAAQQDAAPPRPAPTGAPAIPE